MQLIRPCSIGICLLLAGTATATPAEFVKTTILLDAPPVGLAFDAGGVLYALEGAAFGDNEATLRAILPNGTFGPSFPVQGDDASNFFVGGMAYDPIGNRLLIADNTADGRLYAVDKTGAKQTLAMNIAGIAGVAVRDTGQIFVSTSPFGNEGGVLQVDGTTGEAMPVLGGLGYGAGLAFDGGGNLIVQDANTTTFQGRLQRLPIAESVGVLTFGSPETLLDGMQSSAGVSVVGENKIYTTGSGGLFRVAGSPRTETSFDSNGSPFQFATAIAFDPGSLPFDGFSGPDGGRLAYMADFGFSTQDSFITLLTPAEPGDYNGDGLVDTQDYAVWRGAFGTSDSSADGNNDGQVDAADYVIWRAHLQPPAENSSISSEAGLPEPATITMVSLMFVVPLLWQRRRLLR
jgi:hypothetical protein